MIIVSPVVTLLAGFYRCYKIASSYKDHVGQILEVQVAFYG